MRLGRGEAEEGQTAPPSLSGWFSGGPGEGDWIILAGLADMCIFVVRHNRTDRDLVARTIQSLQSVKPIVAGVVLNSVDLERAYHKDYYYAGYYYQSDDEDEPRKKKKKEGVEPTAQVG